MDWIAGLDGANRQAAARGLWRAWRSEAFAAAILSGPSGVGKTDRVIRPLLIKAAQEGLPFVRIEVPPDSTDVDAVLVGRLVEAMGEGSDPALAATISTNTNFRIAVRTLLAAGALVVVDEFQRLLEPSGRPLASIEAAVDKIARRPPDAGCLWLVVNQRVAPSWTEPFYVAELPSPEKADAVSIVLGNLGVGDIDERFPVGRRTEVVRRLGANPRVLRLLGLLLQEYVLDELLPPVDVLPNEPLDPTLVDNVEKMLLQKAMAGLPEEAQVFLRDLSILRDWAPWGLLDAISDHREDIREWVGWLRRRYLLQVLPGHGRSEPVPNPRYQVHPLVREVMGPRLRKDEGAWRAAHRRAGEWYAESLRTLGRRRNRDYMLAEAVDGAQFHFMEADAEAAFVEALQPVCEYVERRYDWNSPRVASNSERDARIKLLEAYHKVRGTSATHYHLAKLLRNRSGPDDLAKALVYAERSTEEQNDSTPWVLWVQLVREVEGFESALTAARIAATHVAPDKNLYSVYQLLGAYTIALGHASDAVALLREGAQRVQGNAFRLAEQAVLCAAAEPADDLLEDVRDWLSRPGEFEPQVVLADVLLLERHNRWWEAAELVERHRHVAPRYLMFTLHQALDWLGADEPKQAREALESASIPLQPAQGSGTAWLAAFVALQDNCLPEASQYLRTHLGTPTAPTTAGEIRASLLREWDERVANPMEPNPALVLPVLPPTLTTLSRVAVRSQYGVPALSEHRLGGSEPIADGQLHVLVLATEWWSLHGGLSTFNRGLCAALAARGAHVSCVVLHAAYDEQQDAAASKVRLMEAPQAPWESELERLSRRPPLADGDDPNVIIGHGRITGPAAHRLGVHFPEARRLHFIHVIPDDIEQYKLDKEEDVAKLAEERQETELALSTEADEAVAVGPRIYNWFLRDLEARRVSVQRIHRFDPGFDFEQDESRTPPQGAPWVVLILGRAEDARLKGLDLAARAFTLARQRLVGTPTIELRVRGAPEGASGALAAKMREWAHDQSLPLLVRPYSAQVGRLATDLRTASLVLMPSRAEGFGLVGVEAITAGAPVLVSTNSGLGELLQEVLKPHEAARVVVRTAGDDAQNIDEWSRAIEAVLRNREAAFTWASELRGRMASLRSWSSAVSKLVASLDHLP
jgi:glycosyltransferase involved in cell wall biosynthesis